MEELSREYFLAHAGLKASAELQPIYQKHSGILSRDAFDLTRETFASSAEGTDEPSTLTTRKRFLRRRRARRWLVWRRLLLALLLVGAVVGAVWLVLFSSVLAAAGTEVTGTDALREELVVETAEVPLGVPLARVDLGAIEARVEGLAAVKSVEVSRGWPDQVRIEVTERTQDSTIIHTRHRLPEAPLAHWRWCSSFPCPR